MSQLAAIEERLVRTLTRAGEIAVPDASTARVGSQDRKDHLDPHKATSAHRRSRRRLAVGAAAALIIVIAGVSSAISLTGTNSVPRTQISAAQGQRLLCPKAGCKVTAITPSSAKVAAPDAPFRQAPAAPVTSPRSLWVFADGGKYVGSAPGLSLPRSQPGTRVKGVLYLRNGARTFYRFVTDDMVGELTVIGHQRDTVLLRSSSGAIFHLDLTTNTLTEG